MSLYNNWFTVDDLKNIDEQKNLHFDEKSLNYFTGRCLLDIIEYLRMDIMQPGRFSQLVHAHTLRLYLSCLDALQRNDVIQRNSEKIIKTYQALESTRKKDGPPFYGDDFWDWAYIIEALATVKNFFPTADPDEAALGNEVRAFFNSVRNHLESGLTFDRQGEWFGPAVPVSAYRLLSKMRGHLEETNELDGVLDELKRQALITIENGQYFRRRVAPRYCQWHYGQVVYQFPDESKQQVTYIQDLDSLNSPDYEEYDRVYALTRVIQGLDKVNDKRTRDNAIDMLMKCEQVARRLGSGLIGDTIKGSLNALEAIWPIVSRKPENLKPINSMIDALLYLSQKTMDKSKGRVVTESPIVDKVSREASKEVKAKDESMTEKKRALKRIEHLEELLDIEYEKLHDYERQYAILGSGPDKTALKLQMKRETWPTIRKYETELAELLSDIAQADKVPEKEAEVLLGEVTQAVSAFESSKKEVWPDEVLEKLDEIQQKLNEPGKAATAKLQVSLPVIPFLASYNLELDTESALMQVWQKVKSLFKKSIHE